MNLKDLHQDTKTVSTASLFKMTEGTVTSIQISANEQLKEHITKVPALITCVIGKVVFENEKGMKETLQSGDYVPIEPMVKHWVNAITTSQLLLFK